MKKDGLGLNLKLSLPRQEGLSKFLYLSTHLSPCPLSAAVFLSYVCECEANRTHCYFRVVRTQSGTFMDGDLLVNRDGVRIVSHSDEEAVRYIYFESFTLTSSTVFFASFCQPRENCVFLFLLLCVPFVA